jgi:hypothetical protein
MRYFLVTFFRKPGGQIDEQVSVTKRVRNSDLTGSNIIMDFGKQKIEKCVVEGKRLDKQFDELRDYYYRIYPNLILQLEKEGPISLREKETGK